MTGFIIGGLGVLSDNDGGGGGPIAALAAALAGIAFAGVLIYLIERD